MEIFDTILKKLTGDQVYMIVILFIVFYFNKKSNILKNPIEVLSKNKNKDNDEHSGK